MKFAGRSSRTMARAAVAAAILCALPALRAQDQGDEDNPGRGVARISLINGDVSVQRGDSGDWVAAAVNAALVVQDRLATGPSSRAEIQFDYANMLRVASNAEVRLSELEYHRYQIQLAHGTTTFRVLRDSEADVEVSTPNVSVRPAKKGIYRITVREDGETEITVRSGEVDVYTPRGAERLRSGNTMLVRGAASDPEFQVVQAPAADEWDAWSDRRDHDLERTRSYQYVNRDIYGAEDLDAYGTWTDVPEYGYVWQPYVAAGWAPYRMGRWVWLDWYGWSWVSYDPWGWAPYHYGRWFNYGNRWCWWPGAYRHPHYYWSPGLVAFFGWGGYSGVHVGIGFGNVGWVPLAPHERYHPWYGPHYYSGFRNGTYFNNSVSVTNMNITTVYRNARVNGYTAMATDDFVSGRGGRYLQGDRVQLGRAGLVQGALPVTPSRDSLRFSDRQVRADIVPRGGDSGRFYSRMKPAQVDRVSFEDQRRGMEQMSRRMAGESTGAGTVRTVQGGDRGIRSGGPAATDTTAGWRRAGEPATVDRNSGAAAAARGANTGDAGSNWRRFSNGGASQQGSTRNDVTIDSGRGQRTSAEPAGGAVDRSRGETTGGSSNWRRFGDQPGRQDVQVSGNRSVRQDAASGDTARGGRRFGEPVSPSTGNDSGRSGARMDFSGQGSRDSVGRSLQREGSAAPSWGGSRGESIRINPPIVRERAMPRTERSGGDFGSRAPSMSNSGGGRSGGGAISRGEGGMNRSGGGGGTARGGGGGGGGRGGRSR